MQVNDFIELILLPCLLWGGLGTAAIIIARAVTRKYRLETTEHYRKDAAVKARVLLLQDAVDSVIAELETHRLSYETFPEDIRERLYSAHEHTRELT
jgi:hypothetical protein